MNQILFATAILLVVLWLVQTALILFSYRTGVQAEKVRRVR